MKRNEPTIATGVAARAGRAARPAIALLAAAALWACTSGSDRPGQPTVLFDEGHGQHFLVAGDGALDLSGLAGQFKAQGYRVATSNQPIDDTLLSGADVLVISGAFAPYTAAENDAVARFLEKGGRLSVMLHITQPVVPLLERLGVLTSNGVIRERENLIDTDPMNFHVTRLQSHALTRDLDSFDVLGAWALLANDKQVTVVAETGSRAWVDLNGNRELNAGDAVQSFAVAVTGERGAGRFVVFGDDAIFQNRFFTGNNALLGRNLAAWLAQDAG